eukprot:764804-Rhodomonas_salina.1
MQVWPPEYQKIVGHKAREILSRRTSFLPSLCDLPHAPFPRVRFAPPVTVDPSPLLPNSWQTSHASSNAAGEGMGDFGDRQALLEESETYGSA